MRPRDARENWAMDVHPRPTKRRLPAPATDSDASGPSAGRRPPSSRLRRAESDKAPPHLSAQVPAVPPWPQHPSRWHAACHRRLLSYAVGPASVATAEARVARWRSRRGVRRSARRGQPAGAGARHGPGRGRHAAVGRRVARGGGTAGQVTGGSGGGVLPRGPAVLPSGRRARMNARNLAWHLQSGARWGSHAHLAHEPGRHTVSNPSTRSAACCSAVPKPALRLRLALLPPHTLRLNEEAQKRRQQQPRGWQRRCCAAPRARGGAQRGAGRSRSRARRRSGPVSCARASGRAERARTVR
jgi:hypothetical protein